MNTDDDLLKRINYWICARWDYLDPMVGGLTGIRLIVAHPATGGETASPTRAFTSATVKLGAQLELIE
jgi:hypothetical protein